MGEPKRWDELVFEDQVEPFVNNTIEVLIDLVETFRRTTNANEGPQRLQERVLVASDKPRKVLWVGRKGVTVKIDNDLNHPDNLTLDPFSARSKELPELLRECKVGLGDVQRMHDCFRVTFFLRDILLMVHKRKLIEGRKVLIYNNAHTDVVLTSKGLVFGYGKPYPETFNNILDITLDLVVKNYILDLAKVKRVYEQLKA